MWTRNLNLYKDGQDFLAGVYIFQNTIVGGGGEMAGWGKKIKLKSWGKKIKKGKEKGRKKRGKRP